MLRIVPYSALHFSAYESYRKTLAGVVARHAGVPEAEYHVTPGIDLLAGSAAGATAVLVRAMKRYFQIRMRLVSQAYLLYSVWNLVGNVTRYVYVAEANMESWDARR